MHVTSDSVRNANSNPFPYSDWVAAQADRVHVAAENGPLFLVDSDGIWSTYLRNIPEAERQSNVCNACRRFVESFGGLVSIDPANGSLNSALWMPMNAPRELAEAVMAVRSLVERKAVAGVFVTDEAVMGRPAEGGFNHLHARVPNSYVNRSKVATASQIAAQKQQDFNTLSRALAEIKAEHLDQALQIIRAEGLARAEKFHAHVTWLRDRKKEHRGPNGRNLLWAAVASAPPGWCSPRSQVIGSLLEDVAAGLPVASIQRRWGEKLDPTKYMRPTAAPSAGTVKEAERIVEAMGIAASFARRFARLEEVEALWLPRAPAAETKPQGKGFFSGIRTKDAPAPVKQLQGSLPKVKITAEKFLRTVAPTAREILLTVPSGRGPFCGLLTAVNLAAPPILKWDTETSRNPVSWFMYSHGSTASQWNLKAGAAVVVTTICRLPSEWGGRPAAEHGLVFVLEGCKDREFKGKGSALFPENLKAELHPVRAVVEEYSRTHDMEGFDDADACGFRMDDNTGVNLRVTAADGIVTDYTLDRLD